MELQYEYSGLISFRIVWLDLAVQETLKGLLQHHSSKTTILPRLAFFMVQLLHPYMTTGKTIDCFKVWIKIFDTNPFFKKAEQIKGISHSGLELSFG